MTLPTVAVATPWMIALVAAAIVDAHSCRLPDRIVIPGLAAAVVGAATTGRLSGSLIGALLIGLPFLAMNLARPHGFGLGDVKYGTLIGAGLGAFSPILAVIAYIAATVVQMVVVWLRPWPVQRHTPTARVAAPFGPALALGTIAALSIPLVVHAYGS